MVVSQETYERVALEEPHRKWERWPDGLREKPAMTMEHDELARRLVRRLIARLDEREYAVDLGQARLQAPSGATYIPDVSVIPRVLVARHGRERPRRLEVYTAPLPLVAEVWSPTTGDYDVTVKLQEYQRRGDAEIWLLHPYETRLVVWQRQPDGTYVEATYREGVIQPAALPGVRIDVGELFAGLV